MGVELGSGARFHELDRFVTQTRSQLSPNLKLSHANWTTSWAGVGVKLPTVKPPIVFGNGGTSTLNFTPNQIDTPEDLLEETDVVRG